MMPVATQRVSVTLAWWADEDRRLPCLSKLPTGDGDGTVMHPICKTISGVVVYVHTMAIVS